MTKKTNFFIILLIASYINLSFANQAVADEVNNNLELTEFINENVIDESVNQKQDEILNNFEQSYILENDKINPSHFYNSAIIQALDKSTATKSILKINIGSQKKFGNILIKLHRCWQAPLSQTPESKALIEVLEEVRQNYSVKQERIFIGWMFASTPSISSLEHPIYDLTILECTND